MSGSESFIFTKRESLDEVKSRLMDVKNSKHKHRDKWADEACLYHAGESR